MKVFYDKDCDLKLIKGKKVTVFVVENLHVFLSS